MFILSLIIEHEMNGISKNGHIFATCSINKQIMNVKPVFDRTQPFNQLPHLPPPEEIIDKDVLFLIMRIYEH